MAGKKLPRIASPEVCPVCGEDVPRHALACPECGADHRSGWREEGLAYDGVGVEDDFDYDEFVREEFGSPLRPRGLSMFWWIVAILVLVAFVILFLRPGGF